MALNSTSSISDTIAAFEALASPSSSSFPHKPSRSPSSSSSFPHKPSRSPPSSSNLARKTSLIDLQEWVVDDGPSGRTPTQHQFDTVAPLIHLGPVAPPPPPPLPPRKPSHTSLNSVASSTSSSLAVDHTYPPLKIDVDSRSLNSSRHAPASSISSFHSVSLSSDTDPSTPDSVSSNLVADSASLDDSYEEVLTPSIISPASSIDAKRNLVPPKLPQRPSPSALKPQSTFRPSPAPNGSLRRPPPPPPSRSSDRSSIQSTYSLSSTSHSSPRSLNPTHLRVKRPTPVPPAARVRYDAVFDANVVQQRRAEKQKAREERPALLSPEQARGAHRRAVGWRGLSVDLITDVPSRDDGQVSEVVGPNDKLEGRFVRTIWRRSRLGRRTLGEIWNECDQDGTGSLTRDQFAKGMWRIDEELRRAQVQALKSTSTGSLGSLRSNGRSPFKPPVPKNKPILR